MEGGIRGGRGASTAAEGRVETLTTGSWVDQSDVENRSGTRALRFQDQEVFLFSGRILIEKELLFNISVVSKCLPDQED